MTFKLIEGGITAPKGFKAAGIHCGVKDGSYKKDLALVYSEVPCAAAAMYTKNKVKGAPIKISAEHLSDNRVQAIIANSGNANTCNGADGLKNARLMTEFAAKELGLKSEDVVVASTGVIGVPLNINAVKNGVPRLVRELSEEGSDAAAQAIMTTDTYKKEVAVELDFEGRKVCIGGIAKGSGMIEPNMCTMLSFLTTDAEMSPELLDEALRSAVHVSINRISVDGDTSTNDTIFLLANGQSGYRITEKNEAYEKFKEALKYICVTLARMLAKDGEGATKLIECTVSGAVSEMNAEILSKSVIKSPLVKTAMFGADANWGRVLCSLGYAVADFNPDKVDVCFESKAGRLEVCREGMSVSFDEATAKKVLSEDEISILVDLNMGSIAVTTWGCDLTYDYVRINGDYRS